MYVFLFFGHAKTIYSMWNIRHLSIFLSRGLDPWHTSTAVDWCTKCWGLNAIHRVQGVTWDHRNRLSGKTVRKSFQEFQFLVKYYIQSSTCAVVERHRKNQDISRVVRLWEGASYCMQHVHICVNLKYLKSRGPMYIVGLQWLSFLTQVF